MSIELEMHKKYRYLAKGIGRSKLKGRTRLTGMCGNKLGMPLIPKNSPKSIRLNVANERWLCSLSVGIKLTAMCSP